MLLGAKKRFNRNTVIFLACLLLSGIFWLLTSLSREYTDVVQIPVEYTGVPEDRLLVNELTTTLNVEVKSFGFDLLWFRFNQKRQPLRIQVGDGSLRKVKREGVEMAVILSEERRSEVASMLSDAFQLIQIGPDSLFLDLRPLQRKTLPIVLRAQIDYRKQYGPVGIPELIPDSITVSATPEVLDTLAVLYTERISWSDMHESVTGKVKLLELGREVLPDQREVEVHVNVEEYTEKRVMLPIEVRSEGRDVAIQLFPKKVEVVFQVPLSQYDRVSDRDLSVAVDVPEDETRDRLTVEVVRQPESAQQIRISPQQVEYIIQQ